MNPTLALSSAFVLFIVAMVVAVPDLETPPPPHHERHDPREATMAPTGILPSRSTSADLVEAGLQSLALNQNSDGSFGGDESSEIRVGLSAIACMAFLAHSDTEYRGAHHAVVAKAIKFLMGCSTREGERKGYFAANGDTLSRMHGHGYATLALTQTYGMFGVQRKYSSTTAQLKEVISDAVSVIVRSQTKDGGWYYDPFDIYNDESSLTVCMLQALRGARNAGFAVPPATVNRAIDYIRRSQNPDGSFRYQLRGNSTSTFELAAAAISTLVYAGEYYDRAIRNGRDFLWDRRFSSVVDSASYPGYPYYGFFYAVQVLWFDYDRDRMRRHHPRIVDWYRRHFDPASRTYRHQGLPRNQEMRYGPLYRTAFATLTLQIADGFLPIFQR